MTRKTRSRAEKEQVFEGLAVSPGIAVGPAYLREGDEVSVVEYQVSSGQVATEIERFESAVARGRKQLDKLRKRASSLHGTASEELGYLLDAHEQMLASTRLTRGVEARIQEARCNAEAAVMAVINKIAESFATMDDAYLRARGQEIREVGLRIVRNLADRRFTSFDDLDPGSIIIAEEVTPADTALMDPKTVGGFACVLGGVEGHTAIMARSLGLPAVMGVAGLLGNVRPGARVIVDGSNGYVIVNPTAKRIAEYERRRQSLEREARALQRLRNVAAKTRDGHQVVLQANIELPREVAQAIAAGAEGVGLLRTEFLFLNRDDLPDEELQYQGLKEIVEGMGGRPVTIRTLDVGGEKLPTSMGDIGSGMNPALGLRAIRLSLRERKLLDDQLAAILRASAHGPVRILLPLISQPSEVLAVRKALRRVASRLRRRGQAMASELPPLGVMIEVPGAALAADSLAQVADFFAIGTNDLTMYTLAIDRAEESVAHLYNPLHPAVLRLIQFSVEAALRARLPVSICGEMAGDPRYTPFFLGLGVRDLSMTANALPRVKARILALDSQSATRRAIAIMDQVDPGRIAALFDDFNDAL